MQNSVTKKLVQAMRPYHFKEDDEGCLDLLLMRYLYNLEGMCTCT
jgi:hypothetical protein